MHDQFMCRTRCAGPTWHSAVPVADHWPLWEDLPRRYAAAQLALAAHRAELLATGTAERSPATLPNPAADPVDDPARRPPLQQHLRGPVRSGPPGRPGGGVADRRLGRRIHRAPVRHHDGDAAVHRPSRRLRGRRPSGPARGAMPTSSRSRRTPPRSELVALHDIAGATPVKSQRSLKKGARMSHLCDLTGA